jgi:ABC-type transport system substrate-binding protein
MALIGYGGLAADPDLLLRIRLSPKAIPLIYKAQGYSNVTLEALGLQQLFTADESPRKATVQQMQRLIAADVPFISLYLPTSEEIFDRAIFDAWYFTPGGVLAGSASAINKAVFVTGHKSP